MNWPKDIREALTTYLDCLDRDIEDCTGCPLGNALCDWLVALDALIDEINEECPHAKS